MFKAGKFEFFKVDPPFYGYIEIVMMKPPLPPIPRAFPS
jgi:hypothetical protein